MVSITEKPFDLTPEEADWVYRTLETMTLEEKTGQLFLPVLGADVAGALAQMRQIGMEPGGFYISANTAENLRSMISDLQKNAKIPLLIAADLDRGPSNQILGGTVLGCEMAIAACQNTDYAYRAGLACARETRAVGVNWDFGPVVDIDYNYRNPVTNIRTFGSDPEWVKKNATAYARGLREGGLLSCMKHWPGDGRDERDQHFLASINDCSVEEWDRTYGTVFKAMIDEGAETLMSAQIMLPAYSRYYNPDIADENILPGSLNADLHNQLLRGKLGFNGVIVTDASNMAGFTEVLPRREAVPASIANGADVFLFNRNKAEDFQYMLDGVKRGVISRKRLDEAVTRILALKAKQGLHRKDKMKKYIPDQEELSWIGHEDHQKLACQIADESITLVKDTQKLLPLQGIRSIYLIPLGDGANYHNKEAGYAPKFASLLEKEGFSVKLYDPEKKEHEYDRLPIADFKKKYDLVVYFANIATTGQDSAARISWPGERREAIPTMLQEMPMMMVSIDNPYHLVDVPRMKTYINAYTSSDTVLELLVDKLVGRSAFKGTSPVDPFCGLFNAKY